MNLLLKIGEWLSVNWPLLALIVVAVLVLIPSFIKQKKETNARNELNESLAKGTKVITVSGIYGVIESIEDTTDGKVVTITTGDPSKPTTMTIHINAIGGIDNKKPVVLDENGNVINDTDDEPKTNVDVATEEEKVAQSEEKPVDKKPVAKKTTTKKSTTKKTTE